MAKSGSRLGRSYDRSRIYRIWYVFIITDPDRTSRAGDEFDWSIALDRFKFGEKEPVRDIESSDIVLNGEIIEEIGLEGFIHIVEHIPSCQHFACHSTADHPALVQTPPHSPVAQPALDQSSPPPACSSSASPPSTGTAVGTSGPHCA